MTHRGKVRLNNEDSFLALTFDAQEIRYLGKEGESNFTVGDFVFAVGDGMGGANAGEFASRIAVEKITKLLPKGFRNSTLGLNAGYPDLFQELYHEIHKALTHLGQKYSECSGMVSTLSLCCFSPSWLHFAHIGDSRIYYFPVEGGMKQLTADDSHVGWLFRQNKINEREARQHPLKNSIQKALGAGHQFVDPQVGTVSYQTGDRFLICSDGLIDGLWDSHLLAFIQNPSPEEATLPTARRLVEAALDKSGQDNITAVWIEVLEA
jgi:protein phosphatase